MKKISFFILLTMGLFQFCTPETELIFDKPASERINESLKKYRNLMVSDSHGWLVEYYPHSSRTYGGFNLFFQFTDKEVTVKSEVDSPILTVKEATSYYSLGQDMGPTLNFDSYNEILNFFSDPALNVGGGAGYGLEGDYEFVFISGDESEIILRGKKTKNAIRLTPMTKENWEKYRKDALATKAAINAPAYSTTVNGKKIASTSKPSAAYNRFVLSYEDGNESVTAGAPYILTPSGIRFYEPLTVDGVTMQEFTYDSATEQMVSEDGKAVISLVIPPIEEFFANSLSSKQWFLSYTAVGSAYSNTFNEIKTGLADIFEYQFSYAWIGPSRETNSPSFTYAGFDPKYPHDWFGSTFLNVSVNATEMGKITIGATTKTEENGAVFSRNIPAIQAFVDSLAGKYIVTTTDPVKNITSVTLTDPANANRTLYLTLDEIRLP